jgi:hypothetical protein
MRGNALGDMRHRAHRAGFGRNDAVSMAGPKRLISATLRRSLPPAPNVECRCRRCRRRLPPSLMRPGRTAGRSPRSLPVRPA